MSATVATGQGTPVPLVLVVVFALLNVSFRRRPLRTVKIVHPYLARRGCVGHDAQLHQAALSPSHLSAHDLGDSVVHLLIAVLRVLVGVAVADGTPHAVLSHLHTALDRELPVRNYSCFRCLRV